MSEERAHRLAAMLTDKQKRELFQLVQILNNAGWRIAAHSERVKEAR